MTDTVSVSFRCTNCGTKAEWPDDAVDSTKITCKNCGADHGTYGDLRHKAIEATKAHVAGLVKDAFKGF
jgi:DNA-directed RNA polymerase subunit RPC12/RpoP